MAEYRIDELAREAGMTVRNVRAYQDRGLVPGPRREGRIGIYGDLHLSRLKLIGEMLERGYTLSNISELLAAWEQGRDVGELFGFEVELGAPWSDEAQVVMTIEDMVAIFDGTNTEGFDFGLFEASGVVEIEGDHFVVRSPMLLDAGAKLAKAGVPLTAVMELGVKLRTHFEEIAKLFVEVVATHIFDPMGELPPSEELPRLSEFLSIVRPLVKQVGEAELLRAMDDSVRATVGDRLSRVPLTSERAG